jgi:DNA primase
VFTKKNVLFNQARAKQAIENQCKNRQGSLAMEESASSEKNGSTFDAPPAVVIVEGYLDAIALSNVGIQNVVASMGTALPFEQLKAAAEMGNVPGGKSELLFSIRMVRAKFKC